MALTALESNANTLRSQPDYRDGKQRVPFGGTKGGNLSPGADPGVSFISSLPLAVEFR